MVEWDEVKDRSNRKLMLLGVAFMVLLFVLGVLDKGGAITMGGIIIVWYGVRQLFDTMQFTNNWEMT